MKSIQLLFFVLISSQHLIAQNDEPINTDRPDQSDGVYTMSRNHFQIENGITLSKEATLNNLMLRYGVFEGTEARVLIDFGKVNQQNGVLPVMVSLKQKIISQNKIIPAVSIIGYLGYEKIASKDFRSNKVPVNLVMAFQNEVSDSFCIGYNLGTTTFSKDLSFTFSVEYSPIDKLSGFLEYFSNFEKTSNPSHNFDAGILYLINERIQVDCALGTALFDAEDRQFLTFGISYRLKKGS